MTQREKIQALRNAIRLVRSVGVPRLLDETLRDVLRKTKYDTRAARAHYNEG
jgi:hypothetical protein